MQNFDGKDFEHANHYTENQRLAMRKIMVKEKFPCASCSDINYGCGCRGWGCPSNEFLVWFMGKHFKEFQTLCVDETKGEKL